MLIFRFEWKRKRKYILIWAATLAVCIFSMTPVYYGMIETVETLPVEFTEQPQIIRTVQKAPGRKY